MVKNKFISVAQRTEKFNNMVDRITELTGLDHKYVRKSSEEVLEKWEEKNKREISTLFTAHVSYRHDEIHKMAKTLQRYFEPKIDSGVVINKIETIAEFWLNDLFINF